MHFDDHRGYESLCFDVFQVPLNIIKGNGLLTADDVTAGMRKGANRLAWGFASEKLRKKKLAVRSGAI